MTIQFILAMALLVIIALVALAWAEAERRR